MLRNTIMFAVLSLSIALAGCQRAAEAQVDEKTPVDVKKARLIVDENLQLKGRITVLEGQIEQLKTDNATTIAQKDAELQECIAEKNDLTEQLGGLFEQQFLGIMEDMLNEQNRLKEENEQLKKQLGTQVEDPNVINEVE